jgi:hypothetical protein
MNREAHLEKLLDETRAELIRTREEFLDFEEEKDRLGYESAVLKVLLLRVLQDRDEHEGKVTDSLAEEIGNALTTRKLGHEKGQLIEQLQYFHDQVYNILDASDRKKKDGNWVKEQLEKLLESS